MRVRKKNFSERRPQVLVKSTRSFIAKMAGEEVPNRVKRANKNRYPEVARLAKIERRLGKKMQEEPDRRPDLPEIGPPPGNINGYSHPPSSGGTSSTVSEATAENLLKGVEDLEAQEEKMTEATTDLLAAWKAYKKRLPRNPRRSAEAPGRSSRTTHLHDGEATAL